MSADAAARRRGTVRSEAAVPVVVLQTAGRRCAIPVAAVHEVIDQGDVVSLPLLPPAVRGVVRLRGDVLPALDLALLLFGTPQTGVARLVIVGLGADGAAALMVEEVPGIVPALPARRGRRAAGLPDGVVSSMLRIGDREIPLLDLAATFALARTPR